MADPAAGGGRGHGPRGLIGGVIGRVAPAVVRQIDTADLVDAVDVNTIADALDMDTVIDRVDVDAIAERLDMDEIIERVDVDAIAGRLDLDALLARVDVNALAGRLDLDALLERVDVDAVATRLDLDALLSRVDLAQLTVGASHEVATSGLDLVRRQLLRADATIISIGDRLLRRDPGSYPDGPELLANETPTPALVDPYAPLQRRAVSGHYAGPATRLLTLAGDIFASFAAFGAAGGITVYLAGLLLGIDLDVSQGSWLGIILFVLWMLTWFAASVAWFGRTPAMAIAGIAVVRRDGGVANGRRAFVRALFIPVSLALLGLGLIGVVIGKERRALHDVIAGTVVVYDWGQREAEQPVRIRDRVRVQQQE